MMHPSLLRWQTERKALGAPGGGTDVSLGEELSPTSPHVATRGGKSGWVAVGWGKCTPKPQAVQAPKRPGLGGAQGANTARDSLAAAGVCRLLAGSSVCDECKCKCENQSSLEHCTPIQCMQNLISDVARAP